MWASTITALESSLLWCVEFLEDGSLFLFLEKNWAFVLIGLVTCAILVMKRREKILITLLSSFGLYLVWENTTKSPLNYNVYVEELPLFVAGFLLFSVLSLYFLFVRD